MIYRVNKYNSFATYYVADQETLDAAKQINSDLIYVIGTKEDAEAKLKEWQEDVLVEEAVRFSICATFVNGNDTTWKEVQESDPEDTICQVFNTLTGSYTQVSNKTEAFALNEQMKKDFLASIKLDKLIEIDSVPNLPKQPVSQGTQSL